MELLIYKASAGSGKTFTLTVEYIRHLILNPRAYRQILAVTFTNKATGEMKERILQQLYGIWKGDQASNAYLQRVNEDLERYAAQQSAAGETGITGSIPKTSNEIRRAAGTALLYILHDYSRFRVETIDSFFQSVMRNLARELELSPNLNVELNNAEVLSDAVDSLIEKLTPTSPTLAWLLDYINERIADDKRWNVSSEIKRFGWNIFDEGYIERGENLRKQLKEPDAIKRYRTELREMEKEALEQMKGFYDQFEGELDENGLSADDLKGGSKGIGSYFRKLRDGRLSDKEVMNATLNNSLQDARNWAAKSSSLKDDIIHLAESSLLPLLQDAETYRPKNNKIVNSCRLSLQHLNKLQLLANIDEEVRTLNKENNRFLLSDTNALLHNLVEDGDSSFVFEKIGANIRNVMIDEFQDTSRMQWDNFKILLLEGLSQGADSLIVGDVKQSIYRWRNGDWGILNNLGTSPSSFPFPIRVETLKTNRRSETTIIRFNNLLFTAAANYLNEIHLKELKEDCIPLQQAYSDVAQESPKTETKGYVKVTFLEPDEEHNYEEQTLTVLGEEVQQLLQKGVRLNEITILVRKNKNISPIADYFDKTLHLTVVSDEAFRLDASIAICMLMDALRYLSNPDDQISRASLIANYLLQVQETSKKETVANKDDTVHPAEDNQENKRDKTLDPTAITIEKNLAHNREALQDAGTEKGNENETPVTDWNQLFTASPDEVLPPTFFSQIETLRLMPLYELLEELFSLFEMNRIKNQDSYLFSFFDAVTDYLQNNSSDLDTFIRYWDETLSAKTIPSGEMEGIRIFSIHKSKGLEFHTVLIPFCDWKLENETNNQLIWCAPPNAPFNALDIVPVNYSPAMAESVYRDDYLHERLQLWVDNLNLLYVAFTRAGKNLIIWSKKEQKGTMSELLANALPEVAKANDTGWNDDAPFETGTLYADASSAQEEQAKRKNRFKKETVTEEVPVQRDLFENTDNVAPTEKEVPSSINIKNPLSEKPKKLSVHMESMRHDIEFRQSNRSADFIEGLGEEESNNRFIDRGRLLHTLFSSIETAVDIDMAIDRLVFEGIIGKPETEKEIRSLTHKAFSLPQIQDWYSGSWQLFNECDIIWQENGELQTRRPDRVMMRDGKVVIVDFKFGKKSKKYNKQVSGYMQLLTRMNYPATNIEGYLWYVSDGELEQVKA